VQTGIGSLQGPLEGIAVVSASKCRVGLLLLPLALPHELELSAVVVLVFGNSASDTAGGMTLAFLLESK
jgi:hypothetical protein